MTRTRRDDGHRGDLQTVAELLVSVLTALDSDDDELDETFIASRIEQALDLLRKQGIQFD